MCGVIFKSHEYFVLLNGVPGQMVKKGTQNFGGGTLDPLERGRRIISLQPNENKKVKKVKLSLCFTKHHTMKVYWGVEV
jgi:hypothetical protein